MNSEMQKVIDDETAKLVRIVPVPEASGFGVDLICVDDIDPKLGSTDLDSFQSLAQDLYHRITTPRGNTFVAEDDPDWGLDVTGFLHSGTTDRDIASYEGQIVSELKKDDRVDSVSAQTDITFGTSTTMRFRIRITPAIPSIKPFVLVIAVTDGKTLLEATESGS